MNTILEQEVKTSISTPQALLDHMASFVKKTFDPKGQILPMWTLVAASGDTFVYMTPFINDGDKDAVSVIIRAAAAKHNAVMIGFMAETWIAQPPKDTPKEELDNIIPSEYHDRKEGIFMAVETASGMTISGSAMITRKDDGDGVLEAFEQHEPRTTAQGRFANLFPKQSVH